VKKLIIQILKFIIVGGISFIIDYSIMVALTESIGLNYLMSASISFTVSVIFNYILSIKWIFSRTVNQDKVKEFGAFLFLSLIGLLINLGCMKLFVDYKGIDYRLAKVVATAIVMIYNFISRKIFIELKSNN